MNIFLYTSICRYSFRWKTSSFLSLLLAFNNVPFFRESTIPLQIADGACYSARLTYQLKAWVILIRIMTRTFGYLVPRVKIHLYGSEAAAKLQVNLGKNIPEQGSSTMPNVSEEEMQAKKACSKVAYQARKQAHIQLYVNYQYGQQFTAMQEANYNYIVGSFQLSRSGSGISLLNTPSLKLVCKCIHKIHFLPIQRFKWQTLAMLVIVPYITLYSMD